MAPLEPPSERPSWTRHLPRHASLGVLLVAFLASLWSLAGAGTPGWDESGHAFSALRMGVALRTLEWSTFWDEFLRPDFYTPLGRLGMSAGFLVHDGFVAPRVATLVAWFTTIGLAGLLARRVVERDAADAATLWTILGGVWCYLGTDYARGAYQEPWSALTTVVAVLLYLRARERGGLGMAFACGLVLGAALLVKYTYALYVIGGVGLSGIWDLVRRPQGVRPARLALGCASGLGLVLLWWFVLPLPAGLELGGRHRALFVEYLTKAKDLSSVGPLSILIYWPFKASMSLVVFALQVAGIAWGFAHWRNPAARLCALLAFVSALGYVAYPFRIDRFLIPTLFGAWVLAAALVVLAQRRLPVALRPVFGALLVALVFATQGRGVEAMLHLVPEIPAEARPTAAAVIRGWQNPYQRRPVPATGPPGTQTVLDVASAYLNPNETFAWIGGTGTELPLQLIEWRLFQVSGDPAALYLPRQPGDHLWQDPGFDEPRFRAWALRYPQIGVLDPPDPKNRPRPFEVQFVSWMKTHPGFEGAARQAVRLEVRPGQSQDFEVRVYRRKEGGAATRGPVVSQ